MMKLFRYILFVGVMMVCGIVNAQTTISIAVQGGSNDTICSNGNTQLVATVTNCTSPSYQWYRNGVAIASGGTGQTISLNAPGGVADGDIITCRQTNTTAPCSLDTSNGIKIVYKVNQALNWINTSGSINQTMCQFTPIIPIKFQVAGAANATVNGLPNGVSGSYSNGVFTISGTPTQNGSFGYQVQTSGSGLCGSTAQTGGTLTIKEGPNLSLQDQDAFSPFNNCGNISGSPSYTLIVDNTTSNASSISSYTVSWGDGNTQTGITNSSFPLSHTYLSYGVFTLTITATNSQACTFSKTYNVINQTNPAGGIQGPPTGSTIGCTPIGYWFKLLNYSGNTAGTTYVWDFGDGTSNITWTTPVLVDSIFHTFNTSSCGKVNNEFIVTVKAINQCKSTSSTIGSIQIFKKPTSNFTISDSISCTNTPVSFTNTGTLSFNAPDCNNLTVYNWNFGDPSSASNTSTSKDATHTYLNSGVYNVRLISQGACGKDTMIKQVCIQAPPTTSFSVSQTIGCNPLLANFTSASNTVVCGSLTRNWNIVKSNANCNSDSANDYSFISSTNASSINPSIRFNNEATYNVTQTLTNACGSFTTIPESVITVKRKPQITTTIPASVCAGQPINPAISATTNNCSGTTAATYLWSFQNGTPSSATSLTPGNVQINNVGNNDITLVATNECGNTTVTKTINVIETPNVDSIPNFTLCAGQTFAQLNFTGTVSGATYTWTASAGSIGLPTITTNKINSFTAINSTTNPITVTITVTPTKGVCTGVARTFTITVKPLPTINTISSITKCAGENISAVSFSGTTGSTYSWTNANTNIGLAASGNGDITGFTATNTGTTAISGTITVTPSNNGCAGSSTNFAITVNPIPNISLGTIKHPTQCGLNNGSFELTGLSPNTQYNITYNGTVKPAITTNASGVLTVTGLVAGLYANISVSLNNCTSNIIASASLSDPTKPATPVVTGNTPICSGGTLNLGFSNNYTGTVTYNWSGPVSLTNASTATPSVPSISTAGSGNYNLTVTIAGCTSDAGTKPIVVNQTPAIPATTAKTYCQNDVATSLSPVGNNYVWYNNAGLSNGSTTAPTPSTTIVGNTTYYVIDSNNATGCKSTPANLLVTVNFTPIITLGTVTDPAQCQATNGSIKINGLPASTSFLIFYKKNGGSLITVPSQQSDASGTVIISNLSAGTYSNIFVTTTLGCTSNTLPDVTLSDPTKPATPIVTGNTPICTGGTLNLGLTNTYTGTVTYTWTGPGSLSNGNTATPSISNIQTSAAGSYNLTVTIAGCTSDAGTKAIVVNQTPTAPPTSPVVYCQGATATALSANGTNLLWYNNVALNNGSLTAPTPITTAVSTTTYYVVDSSNAGCKSSSSSILVTVNATPVISNPVTTNPQQCQATNGKISFDVTPTTGSYTITYTKDGGSIVTLNSVNPVGGVLTIPSLGAGLYENIKVILNGCPSNTLTAITLSDPTKPATPIVTGNTPICSGGTLNLGFSNTYTGTVTYTWTGPVSLTNATTASPSVPTITTAGNGDYKLFVTIDNCKSDIGTKSIVVNQTPTAPTTNPVVYCQGATATALSASGTNLIWYNNVALNNGSLTAPTPITTAVSTNTYYVVDSSNAGCKSGSSSILVTVNATPIISNPTSTNPQQCQATNGKISFDVTPTTGSYTITYTKDGGSLQTLSNVNPVGGLLTMPNLGAGLYDDIKVTLNNCPSNTLAAITLSDPTKPATPTITAPANICSGKNLTLTASTTSVGVPTYNWTFVNVATSQGATQTINNITVAQSGTYRVNVTINLCKSNDTTLVLTVDSTPVKPVIVSNNPICSDSAIKLSTSNIYPFTVVHNWSFGGSSINNTKSFSIPNAQVNNAGFYRVFVTSNAGCISIADSVNITINKSPSIAILDTLNPTECASAKGYINLNGLLPNTLYHIYYTNNSNIKTQDQTSNGSGILKVDTLRAGTYSNIYVTLNNCPSKTVGPITLVDPTPPVMPTITSFDSICSGKNLSLSANTISVGGVPIYTWTYPTGTIVNGQSIAINNIPKYFSGTYKVYVTINKCQSSEASKFIRVDSTPLAPSIIVNSPVCSDSTIQLQASTTSPGDMSYSWAGVNSFTSSLQNPTLPNAQQINAGNYSVFVTSAIGSCSSTITNQNVTINQSPNITIQDSTNPNQCATPSGFINLNGLNANTSYNIFYTINSSIKMQTQTSNGSGVLRLDTLRAGIYSNIYVTLNGCPSKPVKDVTLVDPNPPATPIIIGIDSICSGQNIVLSAASPITNAIYTWTKPNATTTNATSLTINNISVAESGFYKLYVTLNLCQSKDTSLFVRVDSTPVAPIIVTNSPVCSDSTILLQSSTVSPGSMNYSWTGANSFISSLQNPTIPNAQLANTGSYSVFATSQIGNCVSGTSNQNVVVNASPNVAAMPDTTYKDGVPSGLIAFAGSIAGTTFNWINSNPSIGLSASGTGDISFTTSNTTPFPIFGTITVTPSTNFCTGKPISFKITVNPTPRLTSPLNDTICTDNLWQYQATSATPNVRFTWVRNAVSGITNPSSASADSTGIINETLTNTTSQPINVPYIFKLYSLGSVNIDTVKLTVNPDAKASYTFKNDKLCAPGIIDTANIKLQPFALANGSFEWYADGVLIGTGLQFPGYTILNNGDTVKIKLKANSLYGCKSDSFEHSFYNVKTPIASFTKSIASGCGPLVVDFQNTTTPLAYPTYKWDFGNGQTSALQSPVNISFREDTSNRRVDTTYYIKLTAYTECDSISYVDSVTVFPKPKALFQPDTTVGCSIFHFRAFNNSWGQHNTYTWDFGDSTALVIDTAYGYYYHNFYTSVTDTFNIKLKAVNKCGSDSFEVKVVVFPNTIVPKLIVDGSSNYGCAPVQIRFVNNTVGANKFTFIFGDGSLPYISNRNPDTVYHTYQNGGNFTATLKAQNSCTDSTVALTLQLYDKPQAKFSLTSNQFCKKETIQFKNLSDSTLSFEWWFGDGGTSTNLHPTHRYLNAGNYTVTLIAKSTNPTGAVCTDTIRKTITIHDLPISSFTNNAAIQNCQPFYFVAITNLLPSEIANWIFSDPFSNDTTQAGNVGVHTFKQVGIFKVQLVIFNVYGCTDTSSTNVKVIETPKVAFAISDTLSCIPGKSVTCINQTTYSSADAVNYQWYVNGILQATTKDFNYNFNVPLTISVAANFVVKLVAINSYGCRDSATKLFVIYPKAQPSFAINANVGCVPFNLQFNNTTKYANLFNWYLDGQLFSTSAVPNPIVLSNPATTYNIKLVANHILGCGADSVTKQFTTYTKPVADFLIPNKNSCTGILNIQCFDLSSVVGASITKWNWIFGDGATDTIKNPTHTYTTAGHFNVGLVATDNRGCKSDIAYQRVANFGKPKANFSVGNVCVKNPLLPLNLSTPGLGSTAITNYLWNFGDGNYLTGSQPIYVYQNEGNYTLTLIVTSDSSCVADTMMKTVTVYGKPTADLKFENNCVKENTLFTNTSLYGFGQTAIGISKWTFGDGGTSNNFNAAHIFNATGDYVVQLAVSGNRCPNLTDSIKKVITVHKPRDPVIYPRIEGVRGTPIQFYALSGGVQYNWIPITGLDNAGIQNPIGNYTVANPNIISYTISITDSLGCKVKDIQEVWLFADADIFVPTAFTPNGDGANDILKPLYVNIAKVNYFRIFDRWGKVVFETSDMGKAWDGTLNGGNLPMETYSWMISAITQQGKELIRKGNTTLIRN